jgi:hypothetical protein
MSAKATQDTALRRLWVSFVALGTSSPLTGEDMETWQLVA